MATSELLRVRAGLRSALEAAEADGSREDAANLLLEAGCRALKVIDDVTDDDALWARLGGARSRRPTAEDWRALDSALDAGLPELLVSLGYEGPPPAEVLVDAAVTELVALPEALRVGPPGGMDLDVRQARADLIAFGIRLREVMGAEVPERALRVRVLREVVREAEAVLTVLASGVVVMLVGEPAAGLLGPMVGRVVGRGLATLRRRFGWGAGASSVRDSGQAVRQLERLVELTEPLRRVPLEQVVAQAWITEEAARRALAGTEDEDGLVAAVAACRAVRAMSAAPEERSRAREAVVAALERVRDTVLLDWNIVDEKPSRVTRAVGASTQEPLRTRQAGSDRLTW